MTAKEIITRVIEYNEPPRVGYDFNPPHEKDILWVTAAKFKNPKYEDKLVWGKYPEILALVPNFVGDVRYDSFGNIYGRLKNDSNGECIKGALQDDFSAINDFVMPTLDQSYDKELENRAFGANDKFVLGSFPMSVFSTFRDTRRMDNALADTILNPEETQKLLNKVLDLMLEITDSGIKNKMDGMIIYDDWGTQTATFIGLDTFRTYFKPMYASLAQKLHEAGLKLFVHSCGYIYQFIEEFIEVGVDVLQLDQPELLGTNRLAKDFGGRIAFHSPVDIQKIMATGDQTTIEQGAEDMLKAFASLKGGLIVKDYPTWDSIEIELEWADWGRKVVIDKGNY